MTLHQGVHWVLLAIVIVGGLVAGLAVWTSTGPANCVYTTGYLPDLSLYLLGVAAFLVGLAVFLLIGYNWDELPAPIKLILVVGTVMGTYAGGFYLRSPSACLPLVFRVGRRSETVRFGIGQQFAALHLRFTVDDFGLRGRLCILDGGLLAGFSFQTALLDLLLFQWQGVPHCISLTLGL